MKSLVSFSLFVALAGGAVASIPLGGVGFGNGSASIPFLIPPGTSGAVTHLQTFVIDPAASIGASASAGLTIQVQ